MGIFSNPIFAVLNPVGFIAEKVRENNGGDANERVSNWVKSNTPIPGCDGSLTSDCTFPGTAADWEEFRRNWIDNCTALNSSGVLVSKNKTRAACQAAFDQKTTKIAAQIAAQNLKDKNQIQSLIGTDNTIFYVFLFLFVGLIIYLLMS